MIGSSKFANTARAVGVSLGVHAALFGVLFFHVTRSQNLKPETVRVSLVLKKKSEDKVSIGLSSKPAPGAAPQKKKTERAIGARTEKNGLLKADKIDLSPRFEARAKMGTAQEGITGARQWTLRASDQGSHVLERGSWKARVKRDGSVAFEDKLALPRIEFDKSVLRVSLPFDLTELAMNLKGEALDAPQKKKFLNETREEREQLAEETLNERLVQSIFDMRSRLTGIWESKQLSVPEKKQKFFALWDECDENESTELRGISTLIRASIVNFVSRNMPQDSEHAYSEEELSMLNRNRQSRVLFQPYENAG